MVIAKVLKSFPYNSRCSDVICSATRLRAAPSWLARQFSCCRQQPERHGCQKASAPRGRRQNLQGAGRQDSSVAYEKIHAAFILDCDFARPNFDGGFVSNVALAQIDRPTRRLFEVRDLV